jgi:hypothetical protein
MPRAQAVMTHWSDELIQAKCRELLDAVAEAARAGRIEEGLHVDIADCIKHTYLNTCYSTVSRSEAVDIANAEQDDMARMHAALESSFRNWQNQLQRESTRLWRRECALARREADICFIISDKLQVSDEGPRRSKRLCVRERL